jgi:hypothetical protein
MAGILLRRSARAAAERPGSPAAITLAMPSSPVAAAAGIQSSMRWIRFGTACRICLGVSSP